MLMNFNDLIIEVWEGVGLGELEKEEEGKEKEESSDWTTDKRKWNEKEKLKLGPWGGD